MTPLDDAPILAAAAMRAAEKAEFDAGISADTLMERAGAGAAQWVARLAGGREVLVLCGPGNNGGDGYIIARSLKAAGLPVRVAATGEPRSETAANARRQWTGPVQDVMTTPPAPVLVDALFGTGLTRALDAPLAERLARLARSAWLSVAVDLPSGVGTDDGAVLNATLPRFDLTVTMGALKPAHLLQPSAGHCGTVRLVDIGLRHDASSVRDRVITKPHFSPPGAESHKYSRGLVIMVGGAMPGAAALAAEAALRAGAGYALLLSDEPPASIPHAVVWRRWSPEALAEALAGKGNASVVVGPGLGRGPDAAGRLAAAIDTAAPLVIDGDALHLVGAEGFARFAARPAPVILTPHGGEFRVLFGAWEGSKIEAARTAAAKAHATVVFKGADTVIADRSGAIRVTLPGDSWLSTAGTGDVLAGTIGAMLAGGQDLPADAGVWLHGAAAWRLDGPFLADDLCHALGTVRAGL